MNYTTVADAIRDGEAARVIPELCVRTLTKAVEYPGRLVGVRHPLGFICLPVERDGEFGVCVHVWHPDLVSARSTTSQVHAHSWDLVSFVLYGEVGNTVLRVEDDEAAGTHRVFEIHSRGDVDEILATPRLVRCTEQQAHLMGPGTSYRLPAGVFHATVLDPATEAATVVLGRTRPMVDLSLGAPETSTHRLTRQRCAVGETTRVAGTVLRNLAALPVHRER